MQRFASAFAFNYLCRKRYAMSEIERIQLFEQKKIRTAWDEEKQEWFFSIVDVCGVLTESKDYNTARKYWAKL